MEDCVSTHSRLKAAGLQRCSISPFKPVSTHSRLKAAGPEWIESTRIRFSFNTQPPEGGWQIGKAETDGHYRFNTQPPEGGWVGSRLGSSLRTTIVSTHSRLKAAGNAHFVLDVDNAVSTHSRLKAAGNAHFVLDVDNAVSTHSRLKAAGPLPLFSRHRTRRFNTQPPEGGWKNVKLSIQYKKSFNTQPPEGGWICNY